MSQFQALLVLAGLGYFFYLVWGVLVLLVTAPPGSLSAALAEAEIDEEEEDRQRRRRRRAEQEEEDAANHEFMWSDDELHPRSLSAFPATQSTEPTTTKAKHG